MKPSLFRKQRHISARMQHLAIACCGNMRRGLNAKHIPDHVSEVKNSACLAATYIEDLAFNSECRTRDP